MRYALGKKQARHSIKFSFNNFFNADALPTPPAMFGHWQAVEAFHILGNDQFGNCVWAGAAHEHMIWSLESGKPRDRFTIYDVNSDYTAVTGFDPKNPDTDNGTDMQVAASYRRKTGILDATGARHKIDAYVALKPSDADQLSLATYLFGACGIGLQLPEKCMDLFDNNQVWDVMDKPNISGGHYVPCVGRDGDGNFLVVTWGQIQAMTPAFYQRFNDETVAYISFEALNAQGLSPEGYNSDTLTAALKELNPHVST